MVKRDARKLSVRVDRPFLTLQPDEAVGLVISIHPPQDGAGKEDESARAIRLGPLRNPPEGRGAVVRGAYVTLLVAVPRTHPDRSAIGVELNSVDVADGPGGKLERLAPGSTFIAALPDADGICARFGGVLAEVDRPALVARQAERHQPATFAWSEVAKAVRPLESPRRQIGNVDVPACEHHQAFVL
jgi:hypothetical protein